MARPSAHGTGDDQHRHRGGEREARARSVQQPEGERRQREGDHERDEHSRDAIGEALDLRLPALRLADQPPDLRHRGVGPDPRRPHDEAPARVDRRADHLVARMPLDGHGLARQERLVDRRGALLDDAVGRDLLARPHDEAVTDRELGDRNEVLGAARIEHRRLLRAELEQGPQRGAGTPPRTRLEVPAGEDERRHDGRDLEVDPVVARRAREHHVERHAHARAPGPEKAQRNDRPAPC